MPIDPFALKGMFETLAGDIEESLKLAEASGDSPFARRTYVRSFFAAVEGWFNIIATILLLEPILHRVPLTSGEVAVLSDESYEVDEKGAVLARSARFVPLYRRVRLAFALTARTSGSDYVLDVSGRGWKAFRHAIEIRNRLMHPKSIDDLAVTDVEMKTILEAQLWFQHTTIALNDSSWGALGGAPNYGA